MVLEDNDTCPWQQKLQWTTNMQQKLHTHSWYLEKTSTAGTHQIGFKWHCSSESRLNKKN